ncbi:MULTISPECIES: hypothetical protein [unclassified Methylobacterium]|uniref:hypothetical protein n=1 Tax=unclassified Methylobacterium TaxID=2615210 RepID=UPI0006F5522F|nr:MULTISPECIES: hypothetical protein [unclassified Methylobacterium]KQP94344.1 hypothetical protein ASF60_12905 [Methylobacterium sp. Leaf113]KQP96746.1 hypothetical protein ASF57_03230 [Methylobacterium sp. Leaf117]MCK2052887.1 hypothetical protein [Methylobacterium sp. 37f]
MANRAHDPVSPSMSSSVARRFLRLHESGEVILLGLTTLLGTLWAIVLVTHFHEPMSRFGQALWVMR